jgi:hypothetical protein
VIREFVRALGYPPRVDEGALNFERRSIYRVRDRLNTSARLPQVSTSQWMRRALLAMHRRRDVRSSAIGGQSTPAHDRAD